ncbi:MAG: head-tail joining protein [Aeromonadaceae bacterium]
MRDPFLRANRRIVRRAGRHSPATITTELGEERTIPAIFTNPETSARLGQQGTTKGGRDFKSSAKRLRVLTEDVEGINQEWNIVMNGVEYFPAEHDHDGDGTTIIYLAHQQAPAGDGNGWQ